MIISGTYPIKCTREAWGKFRVVFATAGSRSRALKFRAGMIQQAISSIGVALPLLVDLVGYICGPECASTLFFDNMFDLGCLGTLISKALNTGLLVMAFGYKVPMIMKIVKAGSASGLNPTSMYMETSAYLARVYYHILKDDEFMLWGDIAVVAVQNLIIIVLMWMWGTGKGPMDSKHITTTLSGVVGALSAFRYMGQHDMSPMLLTYSTGIIILSRFPQIYSNFSAKGPGVQVWMQNFLGAVGCAAKCFTNRHDFNLVASDGIAGSLNFILMVQVIMLSSKAASKKKKE